MKKILETLKQKWAEYLLEIAVIIIGILSAYWLNEWNSSLKDNRLRDYYVSSLILDLEEQGNIIDNQLEYEKRKNRDTDYIWNVLTGKNIENQLDTLNSLLIGLRGKRIFHIVRVTYNDMISTGRLNLINNADRRTTINYYESLNRAHQIIEVNNTTLFHTMGLELITNPYFSSNLKNKVILSQKLSDFNARVRLENIIDMRNHVSQIHIIQMLRMKDETEDLIAKLKND